MEFISWDDDIPNIWKQKKMFQTTNQIQTGVYVVEELYAMVYHVVSIWCRVPTRGEQLDKEGGQMTTIALAVRLSTGDPGYIKVMTVDLGTLPSGNLT